MQREQDADRIVSAIVQRTGGDIRLALPLGLGKPVTLVNALVQRACDDPDISLTIFTALTLERPAFSSDVQRRFLEPAMDRIFGQYPELRYTHLLREARLPPNITVNEFFLMAGRWLKVEAVQQAYISANYTHALDVLVAQRPNVLMQLVAAQEGRFSLSSNTDISTDLFRMRARDEMAFLAVLETNPQLPFMAGDAAVLEPDEGDLVFEPTEPFELFSAPRRPLSEADHAMGLHVSRLIPDGGTLQIGIGALGDTVAHALLLRDRGAAEAVQRDCPFPVSPAPGGRFETGLYAVTEMLVNGMLELFEAGVVRREVEGVAIHAGFFVETRDFYARLRDMPEDQRAKIAMVPVSFTNALYGNEDAKRVARTGARFVNGAMQVSALGDVMSDSIKDGKVVSGRTVQLHGTGLCAERCPRDHCLARNTDAGRQAAKQYPLGGGHGFGAAPHARYRGDRIRNRGCAWPDRCRCHRGLVADHRQPLSGRSDGAGQTRGQAAAGFRDRAGASAESAGAPQ